MKLDERPAHERNTAIYAQDASAGALYQSQLCAAIKGLVILAGSKPDGSTVARSLIQVATEITFDRAQSLPSGDKTAGAALLSPRESSILSFAASGKTDAEIGGLLKISARTVRFHTDNAKRKLRVSTRIQAVTEALRLGLIKH